MTLVLVYGWNGNGEELGPQAFGVLKETTYTKNFYSFTYRKKMEIDTCKIFRGRAVRVDI